MASPTLPRTKNYRNVNLIDVHGMLKKKLFLLYEAKKKWNIIQPSSQEDPFDSPIRSKAMSTSYSHLVLFDKNPKTTGPFGLFPRSIFSKQEIRDHWVESILDDASRMKDLVTLERIPGKFCLFAKIDSGKYNL